MCVIRGKSIFSRTRNVLISAITSIKNPMPNIEKITFPNLLHKQLLCDTEQILK
jgi:hypothetical protein